MTTPGQLARQLEADVGRVGDDVDLVAQSPLGHPRHHHMRHGIGRSDGLADLGYRLRRSVWGGGLATEGSRALIDKGFTEHGIDRIVAETMTVNLASRRVLEKCGLTLVRTYHPHDDPHPVDGADQGHVEYQLTRDDWVATGLGAAAKPAGPARDGSLFLACPLLSGGEEPGTLVIVIAPCRNPLQEFHSNSLVPPAATVLEKM